MLQERDVWRKRGSTVLSAPILAWGKLCGLLVSCLESWQAGQDQVSHTLARNTNNVCSCEGPCLFFRKHEGVWKKREKSTGQLGSVV